MDFRDKGRTWVGSIYHKLESICQEVDDFVTKDSVNYVGNQVQTVGEGVKRIYANVLHDFLPPVAYNEQNEAQVSKEQSDAVGTYSMSTNGVEGKGLIFCERQTCNEQDNPRLMDYKGSDMDQQGRVSGPSSTDFSEKLKSALNLEGTERSGAKEDDDLDSGDHPSFSDREEQPLSLILNTPESNNISGSSEISDVGDQTSIILDNLSAETFVDIVELESNPTIKKPCDSDILQEEDDPDLWSGPDSIVPFFNTSVVNAQKNIAKEEIPIFDDTCSIEVKDSSESAFHLEDPLPTHQSAAQDESSLDLWKGHKIDTRWSIETLSLGDSSEDEHKYCCKDTRLQLCASYSGYEDDCPVDNDDPNMETIDLTDKVKLKESSIVADDGLVYVGLYRPRKFRSYKRLIKDAFASRKRLIKEYEQLAVLYGDIDNDTRLQPNNDLVHPVAPAALHPKTSHTCVSCDPEWELL